MDDMKTPIYLSKKLEKLCPGIISEPALEKGCTGHSGPWTANVFYVNRKKCWLVTNAITRYSVILSNITAADLKQIGHLFKNNLFSQLIYDGVFLDYNDLNSLIGSPGFFPTNNDKKTIGFQNHHFETLDLWKNRYGALENMPMKKITHNLNTEITYAGKPSAANVTSPVREMQKLIHKFA